MFLRKLSYITLCIVMTLLYNQSTNAAAYDDSKFQTAVIKYYETQSKEFTKISKAIKQGLEEIATAVQQGLLKIDEEAYNKSVSELISFGETIKNKLLKLYNNIRSKEHYNTSSLMQEIPEGLNELGIKFYTLAKKYHPKMITNVTSKPTAFYHDPLSKNVFLTNQTGYTIHVSYIMQDSDSPSLPASSSEDIAQPNIVKMELVVAPGQTIKLGNLSSLYDIITYRSHGNIYGMLASEYTINKQDIIDNLAHLSPGTPAYKIVLTTFGQKPSVQNYVEQALQENLAPEEYFPRVKEALNDPQWYALGWKTIKDFIKNRPHFILNIDKTSDKKSIDQARDELVAKFSTMKNEQLKALLTKNVEEARLYMLNTTKEGAAAYQLNNSSPIYIQNATSNTLNITYGVFAPDGAVIWRDITIEPNLPARLLGNANELATNIHYKSTSKTWSSYVTSSDYKIDKTDLITYTASKQPVGYIRITISEGYTGYYPSITFSER